MKIRTAVFLVLLLAIGGSAFAQNNARMLSTPNAQTGTSYTFVAADTTRVVTFNNSSPVAVTLPNGATVGFGPGTMLSVVNLGAGAVTITCSSCTINGVATLSLSQGQGADLYGGAGSPAVNYIALASPAGASLAILNANNAFTGNNTATQFDHTIFLVPGDATYPCTAAGILAAEATLAAFGSTGGTVDGSACNSFTTAISQKVDVGCVSGDTNCSSTYAINLRLNSRTIWQGTMTDSSYVFRVHSNSSISCPGIYSTNFCAINIASTGVVNAVVQQGDGVHLSTGVKLDGIQIRNDQAGTVNTALLDLPGAFDSDYSISVGLMSGKGVYIHDISVSIGGGELHFHKLNLDGAYTAGAVPLDIETNFGGFLGGVHLLSGDFGHPGSGKNLINIDGHGHGALVGVNIFVPYMESSNTDTTTPVISIRDARQVAIFTNQINMLASGSTAPCISISESAANLTDGISIPTSLYCPHISGTNNIISNSVPGAGCSSQVRDTFGPCVFISSERNAAAFELGDLFGLSGAVFIRPPSTSCTTGVIADVCGPNAAAIGLGIEQATVNKWRIGMAASSANLCFGQNDAMTTCPFSLSQTGVANTTGLQLFNATPGAGTCPTAASAGATCTTAAITLPVAYSDTNYRLSCTVLSPTNVPVVETYTKSNTTFTVTIAALTAAAANFGSFDCSAVHN